MKRFTGHTDCIRTYIHGCTVCLGAVSLCSYTTYAAVAVLAASCACVFQCAERIKSEIKHHEERRTGGNLLQHDEHGRCRGHEFVRIVYPQRLILRKNRRDHSRQTV